MNKIERLVASYSRFIALPWRSDAASAQRVVFCVYSETEELRLRSAVGEFELATQRAGHSWVDFDLTDTFAQWMPEQKYAKAYFKSPDKLATVVHRYLDWLEARFKTQVGAEAAGPEQVIALYGVGSLFGLLKVKEVVDRLVPYVNGRLVVLFPGSFENDSYRLLDGYDGWNYLATPITVDGAR